MWTKFVGAAAIITALAAQAAQAQERVFLLRHAEKELGATDPALTEDGRERAAAWAEMLRNAGIDLVVTTDAKRTRETGRIVAELLNLPTEEVDRNDTQGLLDLLEWDYDDSRVLIVGHAETIPAILRGLGVAGNVAVSQTDFGNLFVVFPGDGATMIHLRMP